MRHTSKFFGWALSGALCLSGGQTAVACAFHGYTPDPTLVDVLLATEQVVVARLDSTNPNRYVAVDTLMGPAASYIPADVTPATRARLASSASATVLLARDGAYGPWVELAVLDARYRGIIDQVLRRQSAWVLGREKERLGLFAGLVNDPNPDIRRLALRELDRAQYATLRGVRLPNVKNLRRDLEGGDADLIPIRVLLAGLSKDRSFGRYLSSKLDRAIRNKTPHMGAYATAMIELDGQTAVQDILERHLKPEGLSVETKEKLLEALAIQHKTAPGPTRRLITHEVAVLVRSAPELKQAAARQFGFVGQRQSGPASGAQTTRPATSGSEGTVSDR